MSVETDIDVGARLRSVRKVNNLSQRELAKRAGVTNALISMIERGQSSPSVASLKRVLDAVPITFSEFFSVEYPPDDRIFYKSHELREINPALVFGLNPKMADLLSLRQVGDSARHSLQLLHETYEPGADTGEEMYAHKAEEAGIVVSGVIELTVGDDRRLLSAGDAYIFDSRKRHRFRNTGDTTCVIVSACTPATF